MGSSSSAISLSHSFEWRRMVIRLFKEIASRLTYIWSRLSLNLNLPNPLRLETLWDFLPGLLIGGERRHRHKHYRSLAEEQRWWDESARIRASFFAPLDARHGDGDGGVPLVTSYVPRLLPRYRDRRRLDDAASECELTPSVYRKWHRLVFPDKSAPSRRQIAKTIRYLSTRDRREIARIARLVSDEAAAQRGFSPSPVFRDLWTSWLQHKGPDLTVVFE
ncbi:hypothetical protein BJV74DRAFT_885208 [Russula compacta]|nr:hypothetical protein BJV74DRAFT_885208 [Russula compacta]